MGGSMKLSQSQSIQLKHLERLEQELAGSVDFQVRKHWDRKILEGIVPTEIKDRGPVDSAKHSSEIEKLARFEADVIDKLFTKEWGIDLSDPAIRELHYFGIGTGRALHEVVEIANCARHEIVAYDTSKIACDYGKQVFRAHRSGLNNRVFLADIEFACRKKYISKDKATKLIASRVLHVLDKEDPYWEREPRRARKTARTARKIGRLLSFLEVMLIHPCPEDNPNAIWGDTTPHRLEEIAEDMEDGLKGKVQLLKLGTVSFYSHVYTAALIKRVS